MQATARTFVGSLVCWSATLAVCAFLTVSTSGCGKSGRPTPGVYVSPTVQSFGTVVDQPEVTAHYTITNATDEPVQILNAQSSCGCTKLDVADRVIPPGGTTTLTLTADVKTQYGKRTFEARIATDNPLAPVLRAQLTGEVIVSRLEGVLPFQIGVFPPGGAIDQQVKISKNGADGARITDVRVAEGHALSVEPVRSNPTDEYFRLRVRGSAPPREGSFWTTVQLKAQEGYWADATLRIEGMVRSRWEYPREIYLGFIEPGQTASQTVAVRNRFAQQDKAPLAKVTAACDDGRIEVEAHADESGGALITLKLKHTGRTEALRCQLHVELTGAGASQADVLEIPVFARCL